MGARVYLQTFGCKVNQVDSIAIAHDLLAREIGLVSTLEDADTVVINTCSVTARSDAKVRKAIRRALGTAHIRLVVATGCSAVVNGQKLAALGERVLVEPDKTNVAVRIANADVGEVVSGSLLPDNLLRTRVNLKISDGCENFCSYCIVPYSRGSIHPTPATSLIAQAQELVNQGTKEIILTGINIGTYQDGDLDLVSLICRLRDEAGVYRIRVSSIEPPTITQEFVDLFNETGIVCQHLHIPLQSGSDKVLRDMGRHYTADRYRRLIETLRVACPNIAIHTDVIVGYPTETDDDFKQTFDLACQLEFAGMHLFKYSPRPHTPAASLRPLAPPLIEERFTSLQEVALKSAQAYRARRLLLAEPLELLIERITDKEVVATSREHITISWDIAKSPFAKAQVGDIVEYREGDGI